MIATMNDTTEFRQQAGYITEDSTREELRKFGERIKKEWPQWKIIHLFPVMCDEVAAIVQQEDGDVSLVHTNHGGWRVDEWGIEDLLEKQRQYTDALNGVSRAIELLKGPSDQIVYGGGNTTQPDSGA